jgi:hypothetical protein
MSDADYDYWYELQAALANKTPVPAFYDGQPQCGCYQTRYKNADNPTPVRIYRDPSGDIIVTVDGIISTNPNKVWLACGRNSVTYEAYQHRIQTGSWPGAITGIGANNPPADPLDCLILEVGKNIEWLEHIGEIKTKQQGDEAANRADAIAKLCNQLDAVHKETKAPHWNECKRIDEVYLPSIKKGREVITKLKRAIGKFVAASVLVQNLQPTTAPPTPPPPATFGNVGRKLTAEVKPTAKIVDQSKVYLFCQEDPELKTLLQKLAQRALDSGITVPGVEVIEEVKV